MQDLGMTREELVEIVKGLWKEARGMKDAMNSLLQESGKSQYQVARDPEYLRLDREMRTLIRQAVDLEESGVVPWVLEEGLGNRVDDIEVPEVWARRIYDHYAATGRHGDGTRVPSVARAEGDGSRELDGRAIELRMHVYPTVYTFLFARRETVQLVIDQLQSELDRWDEDWEEEGVDLRGRGK